MESMESFEDQQLRKECRQKWEQDSSLRKEFCNDFGGYFAYEKNKHLTTENGQRNVRKFK